jgi:cardiolipin synthase
LTTISAESAAYQRTLEATLGIPFCHGNRVRVLRNGVEIFPAMLDAIRGAQHSIEFLTFVYWQGDIAWEFADALAERAAAGVQVRVILDAIGAMQMPRKLVKRMQNSGVDIVWFRPPVTWKIWTIDNRTHRKVLICDGRIAFTGGVGIAEEWEGDARNPCEWRDTHFQVEGPAVHGLQGAFVDNWVEADRPIHEDVTRIQPLDPVGESLVQVMKTTAAPNWSSIATLAHVLLTMARRKVRITTAYFVPDDTIVRRLIETARRGVDVQVLVPGPYSDVRVTQLAQEDQYAPMMEAGVRIWAYQQTMLHAKIVTVDDTVAAVGSANFNQRSMSKDDELSMMIIDDDILALLDRHFDEDRAHAVEKRPARYRNRRLTRQLKAGVVNLFRHQL